MPTKIEWADYSWNPITGCEPISEGCKNCYAKRMANRFRGRFGYPKDNPFEPGTFHLDKLHAPLDCKKPGRWFVCSMGDLFHDNVNVHFIDRVWATMRIAPKHTFMVLTKRPENILKYYRIRKEHEGFFESENIWIGVTAENQKTAEERIPILLDIPAAIRFVSIEPMLEDMNIMKWLYPGISYYENERTGEKSEYSKLAKLDWVICGAETGPGKRWMETEWAISLQLQCEKANIPFFFKKSSWSYDNHKLGGKIYEQFPET